MALGRCYTTALDGVLAHPVTIEANIGPGLPGIHVVGLADTAVSESRDRIRTAVMNSGLSWPKTKTVVSMSPANLPKSGSHFDLPMAIAILAAGARECEPVPAGGIDRFGPLDEGPVARIERTLFLGELSLDGSLRPVPGVIPALLTARKEGLSTLVIAPGNATEATLVSDMNVLVAATLKDAFAWVCGRRVLPPAASIASRQVAGRTESIDFADIAGQSEAKYAAEVAAAGGHHLMMVGPPGAGKSMIAARLPTILPRLSADESVEATAIHSIAGSLGSVIERAPFIAPHASVTRAALLGGGSGSPQPGAVSLAHHGVLFLDEASEVSATVLDALRAPLEDGVVRLSRARREVTYPARFQLVLAANPCRCAAEDPGACRCSSSQRRGYLSNLSRPLRDRLDMVISLTGRAARLHAAGEEPSEVIAQRVWVARQRAAARWDAAGITAKANAEVSPTFLRRKYPAEESAMLLLEAYLADGELTQRGVDRTLKLAWTLCDLEGGGRPSIDQVSRALDLRGAHEVERLAA